MKTFKLTQLEGWERVMAGEVIEFPAGRAGRKVAFTVNTNSEVEVWAAPTEKMDKPLLLAKSDGLFHVEFAATKSVFVEFRSPGGPAIFITGTARSHTVLKTADEVFTTVEPMGARQPTELQMMQHLMKLNERRNNDKLNAHIARIDAAEAKRQAEHDALMARQNQDQQVIEEKETPTNEETEDLQEKGAATAE